MDDDNSDDAAIHQLSGTEVSPTRSALSVPSRRQYFDRVTNQTRDGVGADLADFVARPQSYLLKIHFDNERVHYEVALHDSRDVIEVGLHFEDGPVSSAAYLQYFDTRIVELKHQLGAELELERWTASWGRLYYLIPLRPLDAARAKQTSELLVRLIGAIQPLVVSAQVPAERAAEQRTGPWRSWRRSH